MLRVLINELISQFFRIISGRGNLTQARRAIKRRMSLHAERSAQRKVRGAVNKRLDGRKDDGAAAEADEGLAKAALEEQEQSHPPVDH